MCCSLSWAGPCLSAAFVVYCHLMQYHAPPVSQNLKDLSTIDSEQK